MPYAGTRSSPGAQSEFRDRGAHAGRCAALVPSRWPTCVAIAASSGVAPRCSSTPRRRRTLAPLPAHALRAAPLVERPRSRPTSTSRWARPSTACRGAYIGKTVDAKERARTVEIYFEGTLVATHVRIERGKQTNYDHYPPEKIAFMMRTPAWCRRRAAELGPVGAERRRSPHGGQRPLSPAPGPGRGGPGRQVRRRAPRRRLRRRRWWPGTRPTRR